MGPLPQNLRPNGQKGNTVNRGVSSWIQGAGILLAAGTLGWGCQAPGAEGEGPPRFVAVDIIVSVHNQTRQPRTIYLLATDGEHLLGRVDGEASSSFSLPGALADAPDSLRLEAREGRQATGIRSHRFHLSHGQQAVWTVSVAGAGTIATR